MEGFDLIVIGGGPGGYEAAELAGRRGLKTALVEKNKLGGVCLNYGCIPMKGYLHLAHVKGDIKDLRKSGIFMENDVLDINQNNVVRRSQRIVEKLQQGIECKLKNQGVSIYYGNAYIASINEEIIVFVNGLPLTAKYLIIATGSQAVKLSQRQQISGYQIIYSDEIFRLTSIPHKMVIVGAGSVGLEAACYFNAAGCEVVVIESASEIGGRLDADIARLYRKILEREGIKVYTCSSVKEFYEEKILIRTKERDIHIRAEVVLIAIGRIPAVQGLGLEECGVEYDKGGICIDSTCRTNRQNVFACGDVTGKCLLAHAAYEQARIIVENLTGRKVYMNYDIIPKIIYTWPEVVMIGFSEQECIEKNIQYIAKKLPLTYSGKYFIEHGNDGSAAKMIIDKKSRTLIGFAMIGDGAAEMAVAVEMMMTNRMRVESVAELIFPHPTVGEILRELATALMS